ncbi:MAG: hypothetical protein PHY70_06130 [Methanocellales archaeon]|nr:hypothetical protein [Methanocellales archaeon]
MAQKEIILGLQDLEKLKEDGRILEAFVILINWFERNLQSIIYYYYVITKKDESKKKELLETFEKRKGQKSRISSQALIQILNQDLSQQEKTKSWVTITRFWGSEEVWDDVKKIIRKIGEDFQLIGEEFQLENIDKLIKEISDFREIRGKVIHRLLEEKLTNKEVEKYYEKGKKLNQKVEHLLFHCLTPDSRVNIILQKR